MKYHLLLKIDSPHSYEFLGPELDKADWQRSSTKLSKSKGVVSVLIEAEDAVALRASSDSIIQLLKIYEKLENTK